jgi:hypothetical protein
MLHIHSLKTDPGFNRLDSWGGMPENKKGFCFGLDVANMGTLDDIGHFDSQYQGMAYGFSI